MFDDRLGEDEQVGDFPFRQQVHVHVEFGTALRQESHPILANEDEGGQKDRLKRNDHRQQPERKLIEHRQTEPTAVGHHPRCEPSGVNVNEEHASRKARHCVREMILEGLPLFEFAPAVHELLDVLSEHGIFNRLIAR